MKFTNLRVDDDGVEESSASDDGHDIFRKLRQLLLDDVTHCRRVLGQVLLHQDLEALDGDPAGQGVTSVGGPVLTWPQFCSLHFCTY